MSRKEAGGRGALGLSRLGGKWLTLVVGSALAIAPVAVRAALTVAGPENQTAAAGESAEFTVTVSGSGAVSYGWEHNGLAIAGANGPTLTVDGVAPEKAGIYTVVVTDGAATASASAVLGLSSSAEVIGAGTVLARNIPHPNGNHYDQVLLTGNAETITAVAGRVTRTSYIDQNDDIVQVEFAGAGTLTLVLDHATGPARPLKYTQDVSYMKGHASIVIAGADESTNVLVFTVGRATAFDPSGGYDILQPISDTNEPGNNGSALFQGQADTVYDGVADLGFMAIASANGRFGGVRTADARYAAASGLTGVFAPGVQFAGPVFAGDIDASAGATPVLLLGQVADARITGGDLAQDNGAAVQLSGVSLLQFADGSDSAGTLLPAQTSAARFEENGIDVTSQVLGVAPTLYYAALRPASAAGTSTASGYATVSFDPGTKRGTINVSFANLSSDITAAHFVVGDSAGSGNFVLGLPRTATQGLVWEFNATGSFTTTDLIEALQSGRMYVDIDTANFPGGELQGGFLRTVGSQKFSPPPAPPALAPQALTNPDATDAARFLTQATFGPTSADVALVMARGIPRWIDDQLAAPMSSHFAALRADVTAFPNPPVPEKFLNNTTYYYESSENRMAAWWKIALTGPDQLRQRVAFALSEILVVSDVDSTLAVQQECMTRYNDILVRDAFGNFRQLLDDVTHSPAMGWWLSYLRNRKADPDTGTAPDENYAREVQQLFTIGLVQLQPDGTLRLDAAGQPIPTYDQATITETAKVFTGWAFANVENFWWNPPDNYQVPTLDDSGWINPMVCYEDYHDETEKHVVSLQQVPLDVAEPTVIPAGQSGEEDLAMMLDTLFNHPNTGPFICRQLIQRLVTSNPSPGYVYRVAQAFADDGTGTRGNLGAVVKAILTDYEARSPDVLGNPGYGKIKEPLLRATAFLRVVKAAAPNGRFLDGMFLDPQRSNETYGYYPASYLLWTEYLMKQAPLHAPTVFNFFSPAYTVPGPLAAAGLVAPEMQITDANFAISTPNWLTYYIMRSSIPEASPPAPSPSPFLVLQYAEFTALVDDPPALLDKISLLFCQNQMSLTTRRQIEAFLDSARSYQNKTELAQSALKLALVSQDAAMQR
ncbi:MAG TPA: DUF1800 family protein [Opitutus sp.]|nr:DUF1800 family protein [Opitutus sp.]